ncbi:hypothetical protein S40288_08700 [Stachybotrys chartarum IBT 40288]|nr:hypothetical protein S40288_08700 [Stachybotrys chartarum IBT 40288]
MAETAFAYHEPTIATILNLSGFLLVLNLVNSCLDKLVYCGMIGQLFLGILWGTPGARWLDRDVETVMQMLGYLGLIMLVYEGGLSTSLSSLRANLYLSLAVAVTGIGAPMGLSFVLMELVSATPLQAFSAGAALSATSLGTTFTILSTTQLSTSRLGTVTTSSAMFDDVIGLVMVQIISNLGGSGNSFDAVTVIRPLFVSIGFGVGVVVLCAFVARPILLRILAFRDRLPKFTGTPEFAFIGYTCFLMMLVAATTYAGTSSLFAAYLAGVITSWYDNLARTIPDSAATQTTSNEGKHPQQRAQPEQATTSAAPSEPPHLHKHVEVTGLYVYEHYYHGPVKRILIPMFFASIGFAIPITEMFRGNVVWRGIVYAILMAFGKLCTGMWLVRFQPTVNLRPLVRISKAPFILLTSCFRHDTDEKAKEKSSKQAPKSRKIQAAGTWPSDMSSPPANSGTPVDATTAPIYNATTRQEEENRNSVPSPSKPRSLYPASILALAMTARGEIGYLIASLAESNGIFGDTSQGSSETYLVVVWAISLCTLVGPISVGTLVKRIKALQQERATSGGPDPLGVWGI